MTESYDVLIGGDPAYADYEYSTEAEIAAKQVLRAELEDEFGMVGHDRAEELFRQACEDSDEDYDGWDIRMRYQDLAEAVTQ